ncbi:dehydrogenase/reductase SDR family member on chromosome X homolog [Phodopus roborovskii]|uniref:dehydrogenase/reductase SDR family member on chromosome X homolog n=1 Tax=Phodopus roborovskii TaxID=109678 RepID=UPI0021E4092E|nr:dehydrogenase/reductase SDR family member on chromosome X homolog [Phodopus roborovskii]
MTRGEIAELKNHPEVKHIGARDSDRSGSVLESSVRYRFIPVVIPHPLEDGTPVPRYVGNLGLTAEHRGRVGGVASATSVLQALRAVLLVYAVGASVILRQLLRRLRGGFRPPVLPWQPDRVALVTGGTEGIGLATAQQLAALGMRVVIAGNDKAKAQEVVTRIQAETKNKRVHFLFCDLASLASVRKFASDFLSLGFPLHVLVNNATVLMVPPSKTEDGFERHMGLNFLGHFLLTRLLLGVLRASGSPGQRSRVVTLGSATHYVGELDIDTLRARWAGLGWG